MDWDDLRFFLELARVKRLNQAGKRLGVDHTTVARRIEQLEGALGCRLFESTAEGYELTDEGHRLLEHAEAIEGNIALLRESAVRKGGRVTGTVRIGTPEGFGTLFLTPRLGPLLEEHPGINVELLTLPRYPSLAQREADMIVTLDPPQQGRYIASRLAEYTYGVFASEEYLRTHAPIRCKADLAGHRFVGYIDDLLLSPQLHYLDELGLEYPLRFRSSGMLAQLSAVRAGLGISALAHYMVDGSGLAPVLPREVAWRRTFWLATHADAFRLRRIRAVWDFVRRTVESSAAIFLPPDAQEATRVPRARGRGAA